MTDLGLIAYPIDRWDISPSEISNRYIPMTDLRISLPCDTSDTWRPTPWHVWKYKSPRRNDRGFNLKT